MAESKIEKYGFQDEVLRLSQQPGMTGEKIAETLTARLDKRDTISQSTVSRWLSAFRAERATQSAVIIQEHIKVELPSDLAKVDEEIGFNYTIFKNQKNIPEGTPPIFVDENGKAVDFDLRTRADAGRKMVDSIFRKLKLLGIEPADDRDSDRGNDDAESVPAGPGIRGIVRSLRSSGLTGPGAAKKEPDTEGSAGVQS